MTRSERIKAASDALMLTRFARSGSPMIKNWREMVPPRLTEQIDEEAAAVIDALDSAVRQVPAKGNA